MLHGSWFKTLQDFPGVRAACRSFREIWCRTKTWNCEVALLRRYASWGIWCRWRVHSWKLAPRTLFSVASGGWGRPKILALADIGRVFDSAIRPSAGHACIRALRWCPGVACRSCLHDGTHQSPKFAAFVAFSVLVPSGPARCALFGQLRKDDLVHHSYVALASMPTPDVQKF